MHLANSIIVVLLPKSYHCRDGQLSQWTSYEMCDRGLGKCDSDIRDSMDFLKLKEFSKSFNQNQRFNSILLRAVCP